MLPLPLIRRTRRASRARSWTRVLDSYTLWAFNPNPPHRLGRPTERTTNTESYFNEDAAQTPNEDRLPALDHLHNEYIERVNNAISENREDQAWALADAYAAEAQRVMSAPTTAA